MENAAHARVEHLVDFIEADLFEADFSSATVVTMYLMDTVNLMLRPRLLQELKPGTRIVSHAFDMGDWRADIELDLGGVTLFKWIVPAQVEGAWQWEDHDSRIYHLELKQKYQQVTGELWVNDTPVALQKLVLSGPVLELAVQLDSTCPIQNIKLHFDESEHPELEWVTS